MAFCIQPMMRDILRRLPRSLGPRAMSNTGVTTKLKEDALAERELLRKQIVQVKDMYKAHPHGSEKTWTIISAVAVTICGIFLYKDTFYPDHVPRPTYIEDVPHMYIRNKRFPWGDGNHTLFHNPKKNAIPGVGYEEDDD